MNNGISETTRRTVSLLIILWVCHTLLIIPLIYGWSTNTLNDELGYSLPVIYSDSNTTLRILSENVTSQIPALIEIRIDPYKFFVLNICCVVLSVFNGTASEEYGGWSFNVSEGNTWTLRDPFILEIPAHEPGSRITFEVILISSNSDTNDTYSTSTSLNGISFEYLVYYGLNDISIDIAERQYVLVEHILISILLIIVVMFSYFLPLDRDDVEETDTLERCIPMDQASQWIRHVESRIDNLDKQRHNLVVESQILVGILGAIAAYSIQTQTAYNLIPIVIVLAIPLIVVVIILMAGPRPASPYHLGSTDPNVVLYELRSNLNRKAEFLRTAKNIVGIGSFYALAVVFVIIFPIQAEFHYLMLFASRIILLSLLLGGIFLLGLNIYRRVSRPSESDLNLDYYHPYL